MRDHAEAGPRVSRARRASVDLLGRDRAGLDGDATPGEPVRGALGATARSSAAGYVNPRTTHRRPHADARGASAIDARLVRRRLARRWRSGARRCVTGTDRLSPRERRGRPAARARRRPLRRLRRLPVPHRRRRRGSSRAVVDGARRRWSRPRGIYERSEGSVRTAEGLPRARGVLAGEEPPAELVDRRERARATSSTCAAGRRPASSSTSARTAISPRALAAGRRVLNLFAYSGGFSDRRRARRRRRTSSSVDSSAAGAGAGGGGVASERAADRRRRSSCAPTSSSTCAATRRRADLVVLDPPPFARRRGRPRAGPRRLQGRQPAGVPRRGARRAAAHVQLLAARRGGGVGRRGRRGGRRRRPLRASSWRGSDPASIIRRRWRIRRVAT